MDIHARDVFVDGGSGGGGGCGGVGGTDAVAASLLRKPGLLDAPNPASSCVIKINNSTASMQPCQTTLFALQLARLA